jgi:hypothetical protein
MSVFPIKYKVLNRETGRKVTVTRWRVQIRKGGENINWHSPKPLDIFHSAV